jgi:hypothetical protein
MPHKLASILLLLVVLGCGQSHLPEMRPVHGIVTFDGQACPGPGEIRFRPVEANEGLPRRPGRAAFAADGRFKVTSFNEGDGLVPGTYRVQIECWQQEPSQGTPGISYIAEGYSAPDLAVPADAKRVEQNYDVPRVKAN